MFTSEYLVFYWQGIILDAAEMKTWLKYVSDP